MAPKFHSCVCPAPWTRMFGVEKFAKLPLGWPADLGRRTESGLPLLTWVSQGYSVYSCTGCTKRCPGQRGNRSWNLMLTPHTLNPSMVVFGWGKEHFCQICTKAPCGLMAALGFLKLLPFHLSLPWTIIPTCLRAPHLF